jgi:Plasmid pRiA4b ORF-3-like protein
MNIYTVEVILISGPITDKFIKKNPAVTRTIEIRGDQTLEDLHHVIFKAFDRFDEHMYEFQMGGKGPGDPEAKRYGLSGLDNLTGDVAKTTLDALKLKKDKIFGYWFDFGDDWWHQVNVDAIEQKNDNLKYPKIIKRVGKSPPQYEDVD